MVTDMDYCVVAIERYSTILEEATGIAPDLFNAEWTEVLNVLSGQSPGSAQVSMRKLMASIRITPALIDADRTAAMTAYLKRYTEELALAKSVDEVTRTRGAPNVIAKALGDARDEQDKIGNQVAAAKLTAVFQLVDAPPGKQGPVALAAEARAALQTAGDGDDDAVADALLRVI